MLPALTGVSQTSLAVLQSAGEREDDDNDKNDTQHASQSNEQDAPAACRQRDVTLSPRRLYDVINSRCGQQSRVCVDAWW